MGNVISRENYYKYLPQEFNFSSHHEVYTFLETGIMSAIRKKSHKELSEFIRSVIALTDKLRGDEFYDEFAFFRMFYEMIITLEYSFHELRLDESHSKFIIEHDFVDVYYTMGRLYSERNDVSNFLYYIDLADCEYSKCNNKSRGELIKYLLSSNELSLWYITSDIIMEFENYKNINGHNSNFEKVLKLVEITIDDSHILNLLKDFKTDLLMQFIGAEMSSVRFQRGFTIKENSTTKENEYQSIKLLRYVGELTWIFEIYVKDKFLDLSGSAVEKTLGGLMFKLAKNMNLEKEYSKIKKEYGNKYETKLKLSTLGLKDLLNELKNAPILNVKKGEYILEVNEFLAKMLYALVLFRNYYAHNMDRNTDFRKWFNNYNILMVLIFLAFFVVKYMFDNDFVLGMGEAET